MVREFDNGVTPLEVPLLNKLLIFTYSRMAPFLSLGIPMLEEITMGFSYTPTLMGRYNGNAPMAARTGIFSESLSCCPMVKYWWLVGLIALV